MSEPNLGRYERKLLIRNVRRRTYASKAQGVRRYGCNQNHDPKVTFVGEDIKVDLPTYSKQHGKAFLQLDVIFWYMATTYTFFTGAGNIIVDRFGRLFKPPASDDWDALARGVNKIPKTW